MKYVALLRGINVGGNNKVSMSDLKIACEHIDLANVVTYINSGNLIFESNIPSETEITRQVELVIKNTFGFDVQVITLREKRFLAVAAALPDAWVNNDTMKCDVLFLWKEIDDAGILQTFAIRPDIDQVLYTPGAILWAVDKANVSKSGLLKIVGTNAYKKMTVRNCNTVRRLAILLQA